ncbi:YraN family protein [soil metagenome]
MATHNDFGISAEQLAADYLTARGWTVLARNWRWHRRELDLVTRRGRTVAFVEVRARRATAHGHPFETISWRKRRDLALAAQAWIAAHGRADDEYRFDAIAVVDPAGSRPHHCAAPAIEHLEDAWTL